MKKILSQNNVRVFFVTLKKLKKKIIFRQQIIYIKYKNGLETKYEATVI